MGAQKATNNTGEVSAIIAALRWAMGQNFQSVCVRFDSEYAANQTQGKWTAKKNKALVAEARRALAEVSR
eukprot:3226439-Prymnesium_polylepis.1